jgi:oxygen-independent coproporphyrinogen-3 oxidase
MSGTHHIRVIQPRQTAAAGSAEAVAAALAGPHPPVRALYVHVPFCFHKCHYCDFYSIVDGGREAGREGGDRQEVFVERLIAELTALAPAAAGLPLETIFVGGGTPSLLRPDLWRRLGGAIGDLFDLSHIRGTGLQARGAGLWPVTNGSKLSESAPPSEPANPGEWTVECNPESASPELLHILAEIGVNRVSIGAQSFNPRHLKTLERWHDPANVARALENAAAAGIQRRSTDLIFAIPGQTVEEWGADLDTALSLGVTHLSCYNLTYEPNTAMTQRLRMGQFEPIDDETEADMYALTLERIRAAGFERYEVSNFAKPGEESQHNLVYWRHGQWLAAGPSAGGHVWAGPDMSAGSHRWKNLPRLSDWLESRGLSPVIDYEAPDPLRAVQERIMMGLRVREGIDGAAIVADGEAASAGAGERLKRAADRLAGRGWLEMQERAWRLTEAGFFYTDGAAAELMEAAGE